MFLIVLLPYDLMPRGLPGINTMLALPAASGPLRGGQKMATARERSSGLRGRGGRGRGRRRRSEIVRIVSLKVNGMNAHEKRKEVIDMCGRGKIDVLGLSETHLRGSGMLDGRDEDEGGLWEGLEGGVIWTGVERERGKKGCALMVSPRVWAGMDGLEVNSYG